jgi:WD40 repeat protein
VLVDVNSRKTEDIFRVSGAINRLVLLDHNQKLGVAAGKELSIFDLASRTRKGEVLRHRGTLLEVRGTRHGTRFVCTDSSRHATVYTLNDDEIRVLFEHANSYYSVLDGRRSLWPMFVNGEKSLLVRAAENHIVALDVETGQSRGTIELTSPVHSCAVSADGNLVLSGGFNHARLLRFGATAAAASGGAARLIIAQQDQVPHDNRVSAVSIGPDGLFATGGWNNEVRLWRTRTPISAMNELFDLPDRVVPLAVLPHQNRLRRIQFTADGHFLVTIQIDGLVRLWEIPEFHPTGTSLTVEPGGSFVKSIDAARWMTSGTSQWSGHMENASAFTFADGSFCGGNSQQPRREYGHLLDAACSPDGSRLATVHASTSRSAATMVARDGTAGSLRFWTMPQGQPVGAPIALPSEPRWVSFRPDGQQLAVCTAQMDVVLVNPQTLQIEATLENYRSENDRLSKSQVFPQNPVNEQVIYSPDGSVLVAWSTRQRGLGVWDVQNRRLKFPLVHADQPPLAGISISPDGMHLAMAGGQSTVVTIINLNTGVPEDHQFPHPSFVHSVEFSPDGNLIVTGCRDGHARLINWRSGETLLDQPGHDADVVAATFTPDSQFLLTLGLDNQLRVWQASAGNLAARPVTVPAGSSQLLVSGDSSHVVVAGGHILNVDLSDLQGEPAITLQKARQLSEILANKTMINGEPKSLSSSEWMARWRKYSTR